MSFIAVVTMVISKFLCTLWVTHKHTDASTIKSCHCLKKRNANFLLQFISGHRELFGDCSKYHSQDLNQSSSENSLIIWPRRSGYKSGLDFICKQTERVSQLSVKAFSQSVNSFLTLKEPRSKDCVTWKVKTCKNPQFFSQLIETDSNSKGLWMWGVVSYCKLSFCQPSTAYKWSLFFMSVSKWFQQLCVTKGSRWWVDRCVSLL